MIKHTLQSIIVPSPSGGECSRLQVIEQLLTGPGLECSRDRIGNLIVRAGPHSRTQPALLVTAHADEVGLQVRHVNENGYVFFRAVGGVRLDALCGRRVVVISDTGPVSGVIATADPYEEEKDHQQSDRTPSKDESTFWIDIGCSNREEALATIGIGDAIVIDDPISILLGTRVCARGLDDAIGVAVVVDFMRRIAATELNFSVVGAFTVQEEIGLRGAKVVNDGLGAQEAVVIDVAESTDQPESRPRRQGQLKLGGGPVINRGPNFDPRLSASLVQVAREHGLKHQVAACPEVSSTDAAPIQLSQSGTPTALVDIPLRYMHTGSEIIDLNDAEAAVDLLMEFIEQQRASG